MQWILLGIIYGGSITLCNIVFWIILGYPTPTTAVIISILISAPVLLFSCYKYYRYYKESPKSNDFYNFDLYYSEFTPRHINYLKNRGMETIKITPKDNNSICVTVNTCDKYLKEFRDEFEGNKK